MGRARRRRSSAVKVGERIAARRKKLGLTQMELAERVGMSFTTISDYENGKRNIALETLVRVAEGLEMDPSTLVRGIKSTPDA
jgi:transcriptional regulator with XRE-family HTH domain